MTEKGEEGPILFCYDGSAGSRAAMRAAVHLVDQGGNAVVLTVWESIATRLALTGAFVSGATSGDSDVDADEESYAKSVAEEGAKGAADHGFAATPMVKESFEGIPKAVLEVADQLSARLLVCGQRGRNAMRSALLGSVSHSLASHARWPILISPEHPNKHRTDP
jgi:nucleotide-binding universal stress UspA family protein